MRLRQLEVFRAVMIAGSVSEAARMLHVSQPVVSRVLRHAENGLGFALFERSRGRLVATPEARVLFSQVQRAWDEIGRVETLSHNLRRGTSGLLRIAVSPSLATSLLPTALSALREQHPGVECDLWVSHAREIEAHLVAFEVDAGLAIEPPEHVAVSRSLLVRGEMVLVAPIAWTRGVLRLDDRAWLAGQAFIGLAENTPLGERLARWLEQSGWSVSPVIRVQAYALAGRLVEQGLGFAFVDGFTAAALDPKRVAVLRLAPVIGFEISLMCNGNAPASVLVGKLEASLRAAAAEQADRLEGLCLPEVFGRRARPA